MDLSADMLFIQASIPIKVVLIILALCSVVCWAVIVEKAALVRRYGRQTCRFHGLVKSGEAGLLDAWPLPDGLPGLMLAQARAEMGYRGPTESAAERRDRVEQVMREALTDELLRAEARLPYLATISSVAPFIGLFGTVWGIMHAFVGIAQTSDTSLAVVAPGIAESLFTTAAGLVAAIPASIAYNKLASDFRNIARRMSLSVSILVRRNPALAVEADDDAA